MIRFGPLLRLIGRKLALFAIWLAAFGVIAELGKATGLASSDRPDASGRSILDQEVFHAGR